MKGLSFTAPMVKAWLSGNKSVTRRLMKPQPDHCHRDILKGKPYSVDDFCRLFPQIGDKEIKPPYRPGETVYIKETWMEVEFPDGQEMKKEIVYKATDWKGWLEYEVDPLPRWKSPRYMPEWASRSHALIVSVRPERVQEISGFEAVLEGFGKGIPEFELLHYGGYKKARKEFIETWESLHPGSWEKNEWCWRIELNKEDE